MDVDKATDEELVEAFKQTRQLEYLNKLTERHLDRVYAAIRAMVLDAHAAEDLTQEVFLRVSRSLHRFRGKSQFRTWLYRVQINVVQDYRRKAARHKETALENAPEQPAGTPDAARQVMAREEQSMVVNAMQRLSPVLREAVVLTVLEGLPVAGAARAAGCPVATMYWRVHAARKELAKVLQMGTVKSCMKSDENGM